jgi:hypothetical protein
VDKAVNHNPMSVAPGTYDPKKGERMVHDNAAPFNGIVQRG